MPEPTRDDSLGQCCAAPDVRSYVQYGSYFTKCDTCGLTGAATSWLAISRHIRGHVTAVAVDASGRPVEEIAKGSGAEVMAPVARSASLGRLIRLDIAGD